MVDVSELKWAHKVSNFQFVEVELDVAIRFATAPPEERPLILRPVKRPFVTADTLCENGVGAIRL